MRNYFKHSGHLGDIFYSLALIKEISHIKGRPSHLHIRHDAPGCFGAEVFHSKLDVMVSFEFFNYIQPLLVKRD